MELTLEYCTSHKTKNATRGYKVRCPNCSGKDLWVTLDNGKAYCFECGASYIIEGKKPQRDLEPMYNVDEIRAFYTAIQQYYHSNITTQHRDYLYNRGLDDTAIRTFMIGFCPSGRMLQYRTEVSQHSGLANKNGESYLAGRITFPYIASNLVTDVRGRSLNQNDPMKYKSPRFSAHARGAWYPFNFDRAYERAKEQKRLIITEGEIKAIVADMFGYAAVALPGMATWRKALLPDKSLEYIILFDSSAKAKDMLKVAKAVERVVDRIPFAKVAQLPLLGEQKQDIDSFLLHKKGGKDYFDYVLDSAVSYDTYQRLRRF